MALCFSFFGKLVHPASEHNVENRYLIIWVWFTNVKLTLDYFKIRIPHSGEVNKWIYNSSLPYAFVEGTGKTLLKLLSSSRHLQNCTSQQRWRMLECYHTHAFMTHTLHTNTACQLCSTSTLPVSKYAVICFQSKTKQFWSAKSRHMRRRTFDGKAHVANAKTW
jgi:hypothetical protein